MSYTDNPIADFEAWDAEQKKELDKLPVCNFCCDPIQDDHYYLINGDNVCHECLENEFRKDVDFE